MRGLESGQRCRLRCDLVTEPIQRHEVPGDPYCWTARIEALGRIEFWTREGFYQEHGLDALDIVEVLP
jgi:hypothetical protein